MSYVLENEKTLSVPLFCRRLFCQSNVLENEKTLPVALFFVVV